MANGQARGRRLLGAAALVGLLVGGVACGDGGDDPDDDAEEVLESMGARSLAETLRALMFVDDAPAGQTRRHVDVIQEAIDDLPEPLEPEVDGLTDGDGDGIDDDGLVEVRVDTEVACLKVGEGDDLDVTGGAC
jgi:hypothetical protein